MGIYSARYTSEKLDFLCAETLFEIDYGILDLSHVKNVELRNLFCYLEEVLTVELMLNYRQNRTGMFRVHLFGDVWCYCERDCIITAGSCRELEERVISENRIWYVFDEFLAGRLRG